MVTSALSLQPSEEGHERLREVGVVVHPLPRSGLKSVNIRHALVYLDRLAAQLDAAALDAAPSS